MNPFFKLWWYIPLITCALAAQQNLTKDSLDISKQINDLDEIVLIDSRFPLKRSESGKNIIKITQATIDNFQGLGLSSLLKQYAGIEILGSQTYAGQNKTISIRGGRNRQVLILIDGIRVSDPSRIDSDFNLNFLDLGQIESIEILKGASSTLYGSSAASGVINIKTKNSDSGLNLRFQSITGSQNSQNTVRKFNLFKNNLQISGGGERFKIKGYANHDRTTGMSAVIGDEFDPFDQFNFGASIKFENEKTFNIKTGFDFSDIQSDYDNNFPLEDAPFKLSTQMNRFHLNSNYNYKNGGLSLRIGHQKTKRDFQSSFPFQTDAENTQLEIFNKYVFKEEFYTVVGVLIQQNFADYEGGQKTTQNDFFGNFIAKFSDDFRINLGGRWNNNFNYGSQFTYSINPSWRLINGNDYSLKIHSALSTAFIAPSLYQLFDPYSGNIDLKPEENTSFEAGLIFNNKKWSFSSNYFSRLETPSLVYDLVTYRYENAFKEARYYGVETVFSGFINSKIFIDQQITFTETKDGDLRYLPNFSSQTNLSYSFLKSWNANLTVQLFGKRFGLDNITVLDEYQLLNLSISHQITNIALKLFVHATNILNTDYTEIDGYATKGRNLVAGISYQLP